MFPTAPRSYPKFQSLLAHLPLIFKNTWQMMPDGSQSSPAPMASEKIPQGKYFSVCVKILLFIHRKVETAGVYLILFCFETGMNPLLRKTSISAVNQIMFILFSRLQHLNCYVLFRI